MPITQSNPLDHPIRVECYRRRISRRQLAEATGYAVGSVQHFVSGRQPIPEGFARKASEFLGMPIEELFTGLKEDPLS
jgi:transcriptional regulator with XRE-family HTH domain